MKKKRGIVKILADLINPYSWITAARNRMFDTGLIKSRAFGVPTVCVGNITVGGTGKTPHVEYIVRLFKDRIATAVLSRGYGRKSKGFVVAGIDTPAGMIGDEPFQIKNKFSDMVVAVCEKRADGIRMIAEEFRDTGLILLDDAFQHRHVKAGLNILLIDSQRPLWNDCILPFGRLRESVRGIRRADIVIFTKCGSLTAEEREEHTNYIKRRKDIPVFFSRMRYGRLYKLSDTEKSVDIQGKEALLVTGIANPQPLKREIERASSRTELAEYGDHHNFTARDFVDIERKFNALQDGNRIIVTTEKDAARISCHEDVPETLKEHIYVMPIEVEIMFNEEKLFNQILEDYVTENSRDS
ncbi:MAG: tetraacyldisaccharide 4'-kinase [Bacteroidaceae bacterium]|nr:tetraacyldisaccharide 4'-kinase [Bacteroidaceae bacterium]